MSNQLLLTALILALTVIIPIIVGLVALSTPMFVPETPETGSVADVAPISLNMRQVLPLGTVLPVQAMLAAYVADLKAEAELVFTPVLTTQNTLLTYIGVSN